MIKEGDVLEIIEDEYDGAGEYYIREVVDTETWELDRAPGVADSGLDYTIGYTTTLPLMYLVNMTMAYLYEKAMRDRPGVVEESYIRFASYYRQLANQELKYQLRHGRARRRH
jgi:hypothetical protein